MSKLQCQVTKENCLCLNVVRENIRLADFYEGLVDLAVTALVMVEEVVALVEEVEVPGTSFITISCFNFSDLETGNVLIS